MSPFKMAANWALTAGSVGIMASLVVNHAKPVLRSPGGLVFAALAFIGVGVLGFNMLLVLAILTPLASWSAREEGRP